MALPSRLVLIVEDNQIMAEMYALGLNDAGWRVSHASDGRAAIRLAASERPDVILLDLRLPGLDGLTVLKALVADKLLGGVPVVVFSNSSRDDSDAREALRLGAVAYLIKAQTTPASLAGTLAELMSA